MILFVYTMFSWVWFLGLRGDRNLELTQLMEIGNIRGRPTRNIGTSAWWFAVLTSVAAWWCHAWSNNMHGPPTMIVRRPQSRSCDGQPKHAQVTSRAHQAFPTVIIDMYIGLKRRHIYCMILFSALQTSGCIEACDCRRNSLV